MHATIKVEKRKLVKGSPEEDRRSLNTYFRVRHYHHHPTPTALTPTTPTTAYLNQNDDDQDDSKRNGEYIRDVPYHEGGAWQIFLGSSTGVCGR